MSASERIQQIRKNMVEDILQLYPAGEFELEPRSTALLIIDMQKCGCYPDMGTGKIIRTVTPKVAKYWDSRLNDVVVPNIQKLLNFFRANGLRVLYTCVGPLLPDGSDMYQVYMNGSATAGQCFWFLDALYKCGMRKQANEILKKMCDGYYTGQMCGPLNSGLDWRGWDGRPAGYEGLLSDMYHALQVVLTGYLGWEYTLDGLKAPKGSAADFLMQTRRVYPDFGQVLK